MKRVILAASILLMAAATLWSQPKVAVLDAIIPQNMDPSVVVPVTEKIVERLVVSGRFTVLDRANIESVLKEREFQVSGMVSDQDVVTAGKYLGADFVVVAKVQKVGDTFFISAKMIAIKTGVIANQTSAQGEGKLSTLISIAEEVGEVLSGGAVLAQSAAGEQRDISKPEESRKVKPARTSQPKDLHRALAGLSLGFSMDQWKATAGDSFGDLTVIDNWNSGTINAIYIGKYFQAGVGLGSTLFAESSTEDTYTSYSDSYTITSKQLNLCMSILGKLPITLGSITIFALGGVEYDMNLSWKADDGTDLRTYFGTSSDTIKGLNHLYLQVGGGFELPIGPAISLVPELVYGWKMKTASDTNAEDNLAFVYSYPSVQSSEGKLDINVAVAFKL